MGGVELQCIVLCVIQGEEIWAYIIKVKKEIWLLAFGELLILESRYRGGA